MNKTIKIFENEANIYSGNCYVNTVIFRGRIYDDFKEIKSNGIKFLLQISNGKDDITGQWNKPTFAECCAFGETAKFPYTSWFLKVIKEWYWYVDEGDGLGLQKEDCLQSYYEVKAVNA